MKRTKKIEVRLTEESYTWLKEEAEKRGWYVSELVRDALETYLSDIWQMLGGLLEYIDQMDEKQRNKAIEAICLVPTVQEVMTARTEEIRMAEAAYTAGSASRQQRRAMERRARKIRLKSMS